MSESQLCYLSAVADDMLLSTLSCLSSTIKCDRIVGSLTDDVFALFWVASFSAVVELSWLDNSSGFLRFTEAERLLCIICRVKSTNFALFYTMVVLAYHMSTGIWRLEAARTGRAKHTPKS